MCLNIDNLPPLWLQPLSQMVHVEEQWVEDGGDGGDVGGGSSLLTVRLPKKPLVYYVGRAQAESPVRKTG